MNDINKLNKKDTSQSIGSKPLTADELDEGRRIVDGMNHHASSKHGTGIEHDARDASVCDQHIDRSANADADPYACHGTKLIDRHNQNVELEYIVQHVISKHDSKPPTNSLVMKIDHDSHIQNCLFKKDKSRSEDRKSGYDDKSIYRSVDKEVEVLVPNSQIIGKIAPQKYEEKINRSNFDKPTSSKYFKSRPPNSNDDISNNLIRILVKPCRY